MYRGKIAALVFILICKIDSLRLTISLDICLSNYSLRRSISPVWWLKDAALNPVAAASFMRPFFRTISDSRSPAFEKYIVRSIVFGRPISDHIYVAPEMRVYYCL